MGTLYVVSTPIGNLSDITLRAIEMLKNATYIACEDTRKTGLLLAHLRQQGYLHSQHRPMLISYYEENEWKRIPKILNLLINGKDVALVSDGGTPAISDPGFKLIRACLEQGIQVVALPGASAVISALVTSGLPTDKFFFLGFLPKKPGNRKTLLEQVKHASTIIKTTYIVFESPHRLSQTLESMKEVLGNIDIVVCRELTKVYEETIRASISEVLTIYSSKAPKGEFVILFHL